MSSESLDRSTGLLPSPAFANTLDKLKLLNYYKLFCKPNNLSALHFYYFQTASNPSEQFYYFVRLFAWILAHIGHHFDVPGQFDDPNASVAKIGHFC